MLVRMILNWNLYLDNKKTSMSNLLDYQNINQSETRNLDYSHKEEVTSKRHRLRPYKPLTIPSRQSKYFVWPNQN